MIHVLQSNHPKAKSLRLRPMALKWGLKRCTMFNDLLCTVHFVLKIFGLWNSFFSAISFVLSISNPKQPKSFSRIFTNRYFFMISSKGLGLWSQPEIKIATLFFTTWQFVEKRLHNRTNEYVYFIVSKHNQMNT